MPSREIRKILVLEDDDTTQTLLRIILEGAGYTPIVASTATAAWCMLLIHRMSENPILAITVDLHLPGMSGLQFIRSLRETYKPEELPPIIVVSGDSNPAVRAKLNELGIADFIQKPFAHRPFIQILDLHTQKGVQS